MLSAIFIRLCKSVVEYLTDRTIILWQSNRKISQNQFQILLERFGIYKKEISSQKNKKEVIKHKLIVWINRFIRIH